MEWSDITDIIKKVAPAAEGLLATFGGPPGMIAAGAIKAVTSVFGLSEGATLDQLEKAISSDPQAALKLALAEQDFKVKMREQDIEELKTQLSDVQNARNRQIEHEKATGKTDRNLYALAWWCVACPVALLSFMIYYGLPEMKSEVALLVGGLIGIIIGEYKTVIGFFFGSSKSSSDKTKLMALKQ